MNQSSESETPEIRPAEKPDFGKVFRGVLTDQDARDLLSLFPMYELPVLMDLLLKAKGVAAQRDLAREIQSLRMLLTNRI